MKPLKTSGMRSSKNSGSKTFDFPPVPKLDKCIQVCIQVKIRHILNVGFFRIRSLKVNLEKLHEYERNHHVYIEKIR